MTSRRDDNHDQVIQDSEAGSVRVFLEPSRRTLVGRTTFTYADLLSMHDVALAVDCGGRGTCGKCAIRFLSDAPKPSSSGLQVLSPGLLASGWRLACQHVISDGATIEVASERNELREKSSSEFDVSSFGLDPDVLCTGIELPPANNETPDTATAACRQALGRDVNLSLDALRGLSLRQRNQTAKLSVIEDKRRVLAIRTERSFPVLGLAVDIGTTTLAAYVFDLSNGKQLASRAGYNPQRSFGADVIARIGHVRLGGQVALSKLQAAVLEGLNVLVEQCCADIGIASSAVYRASIVGNPTMLHLLLGVSPVGIDQHPYASVFLEGLELTANQVGLSICSDATVVIVPGVSSYVGADIVAGILSSALGSSGSLELLVDVGTNGEMALAVDGRLVSCSTAAGPAFEGATIQQGMNALPGAIEDILVDDGRIRCSVIGKVPAKGLCGTGLIGAVDELRAVGMIDQTGQLVRVKGPLAARYQGEGKNRRVLLTEDGPQVFLYQKDIREFQLGKAAIRAGIDTLLAFVGARPQDLSRLYVAGAFGTHLRPQRALRTGLLPDIPEDHVFPIGNSAGRGAAAILLNHQLLDSAAKIASRVEYIELSKSQEFSARYVESMAFPALLS